MTTGFDVFLDGRPFRADRGSLVVPEDRDAGGSSAIRLQWVRLHGAAESPGSPLVYLAEGPGVPVLCDVERPGRLDRWLPFLASRDVVLFDQRGCGVSERDLRWRDDSLPPDGFFVDGDVALEHVLRMSRRARSALEDAGARLTGYNARESALDVVALLDELGCERATLAGFSWGAQLAVEVLRRHPERIERAVLAGTEGPANAFKLPLGTDRYLDRVGSMARPAVDFADLIDSAFECLERDPASVEIEHRTRGERFVMRIGRFGLAYVVCRELWAAGALDRLPAFLERVAAGDDEELAQRIARHVGVALRVDAMPLLVDGASGASEDRLRLIAEQSRTSRFGNAMNFPFPEVSDVWQPYDLGDAYRSEIGCDVPTLFLSGDLDWNAPAEQTEEVAAGFDRATHLRVHLAVHEQVFAEPDVLQAAASYLDDPSSIAGRRLELPAPRLFGG